MSDEEYDEDWESRLYPHEEEYDDEEYGDEEEYGEGEYEEEYGDEGKSPYEKESDNLKGGYSHGIDPSDWGRFSFGTHIEGVSKIGKEKALRDPRSVSLIQTWGALLNNSSYGSINKHIKDEAYNLIEKLPEKQMVLYNIDILTAAALFTVIYQNKGGLTKNNIAEFIKTTNDLYEIDHLDFIRYIRILETSA